ncbi:hypothetical protein SCLCIDRAFT_1187062 [Scleroderma citrinum Foug A]|uniref:Uncharacterized protein n=1 Tax=Scleroderma citrinum Foug A TaxID=1036808 RepID=A0A0C3A480_9AGAM|nr:hypothetical protein SCLCIDRAFT_1187062 [Scleroderma citrinum Foug A]
MYPPLSDHRHPERPPTAGAESGFAQHVAQHIPTPSLLSAHKTLFGGEFNFRVPGKTGSTSSCSSVGQPDGIGQHLSFQPPQMPLSDRLQNRSLLFSSIGELCHHEGSLGDISASPLPALLMEEVKKVNVRLRELHLENHTMCEELTSCVEQIELAVNAVIEKVLMATAKLTFEEVEGRVIWRPLWAEQVDHMVNLTFLDAVVDSIMAAEKTKREKGMKELDNADYDKSVVMMMVKSYWQTLAGETYNVQGVIAMINTDFGSEHLTIHVNSLSEATNNRCQAQDIPISGWKTTGLKWQSIDYVTFLHVLDSIHKKQRQHSSTNFNLSASTSGEPATGLLQTKPNHTLLANV